MTLPGSRNRRENQPTSPIGFTSCATFLSFICKSTLNKQEVLQILGLRRTRSGKNMLLVQGGWGILGLRPCSTTKSGFASLRVWKASFCCHCVRYATAGSHSRCISNWPHCYFGAAPRKCIAWQSCSFILVLSEFIWLRWWSGFSNRANILCGAKEWTRLQPAFDCEGVRAAQLMVSLRSSLWSPLEIITNPPILFRKTDSSCIG